MNSMDVLAVSFAIDAGSLKGGIQQRSVIGTARPMILSRVSYREPNGY